MQATDYRIPAPNAFQPNHYMIEGREFPSKVKAVRYVGKALGCGLNEANDFVESLPDSSKND